MKKTELDMYDGKALIVIEVNAAMVSVCKSDALDWWRVPTCCMYYTISCTWTGTQTWSEKSTQYM